jgi:recombination protein RecT
MSELARQETQISERDVAVQTVVQQVRSPVFREQLVDALPESVTVDKFVRVAITAIRENNALAEADLNSLFGSIVKCAQDGLYPDGREAALVLYKGKVGYLPMIGGFRKIAAEYGWALRTKAVYANDEFDYTEEPPTMTHRPVRPGAERGALLAAYAVATHRDGRRIQTVLHPEDIAKRRAMAQTQQVWDKWTPEMWEKSAGRAVFSDLPLDSKDRERVERMFSAELEPAAAAVAMYGPAAAQTFTDTPAPPPADVPVEPEPSPPAEPEAAQPTGPGTDGGDQQAEGGGETPSPPAAPAPGHDDDDPEPKLGDAQFLAPADAEQLARDAAAAGEAHVPNGDNKGLTVRQVAEKGAKGEEWLGWVLRKWARDTFRAAVEMYVRVYLPDTWAKYEAWLAAQQGEQS